ncbi:MAG: MotA/TolQ/ExbB proton channel family protein [Verrucomicrobia bacterium]|nr:MotA/TolQ/ExbB proton channel family protein [Verrucomicrobiota bacterium]
MGYIGKLARMFEAIYQYWYTGGPLMIVLALVSLGIWYLFLQMRRRLVAIVKCVGDEATTVKARTGGTSSATSPQNILENIAANVIRAARRNESVEDAFEVNRQATLDTVRRDMLLLAAMTAAAPLLGLLGTVMGMVATFRAVSGAGGHTAIEVSSGISRALITTQIGLVAAIPGLFGLSRVQRLHDQARVRLAALRTHLLLALNGDGEVVR